MTGESENRMLYERQRDISVMEMGCDNITVSCSIGKIVLWFGKQAEEAQIWKVISGISNIDSSVNHEYEVICDYNEISEYESKGYVLTSYAKTRGGYRAIFNVPFSKKLALAHFVESILKELKNKDVKKTLHWNGGSARMLLMYNELKKLDGWEIKHIVYKDEENERDD